MGDKSRRLRLGVNTLFLVPGDVGGTETFLRETLKALAAGPNDVELVLFTSDDNDALLRSDLDRYPNVSFRHLRFSAAIRPLRIVIEQTLLPAACFFARLDCLWSPGYTAPFLAPCRQAVTIPDLQYKSHPEDMSRIERWVLDVLVRIACTTSRTIFTISEFSKREVVKYGFAPAEKIRAVLLGVDQSFGTIRPEEERRRILQGVVPTDQPYILCVAHSYPHKNVNLLVDAFNQLSESITHNLVIVGKPRRGEKALTDSIAGLKSRERLFRFKEGLPYETLQVLYQGADVFVLPSAYEGFGLPVIEAMMAGVPVVTSREGSLPEVGGELVVYVDALTAEDIARAIGKSVNWSKEEREMRCDGARRWAGNFTWQRSAEKLIAVFQEMTAMP